MGVDTDFSSNRHSIVLEEPGTPTRHPDISFEDGNLAIVSGTYYFLVHRKVLSQHSDKLDKLVESLRSDDTPLVEGRPVLPLDDSPEDLSYFLQVLYGFVFLTEDFGNYKSSHRIQVLLPYRQQ